ncbi:hypothetical protein BaRGS_00036296, partial [Batillaria attramentaria]
METFATCPKNHTTHDYLACDVKSDCWGKGYGPSYTCDAPMTPLPPSLACASGMEFVPYTLVCDHRPDCGDSSDEAFCVFPTCDRLRGQTTCGDKQCVPRDNLCDDVEHCVNAADEKQCSPTWAVTRIEGGLRPPAELTISETGTFKARNLTAAHFPELRFLDARSTNISPVDVVNNAMLISLGLANCRLSTLGGLRLPNLRILDLSDNHLTTIAREDFTFLQNLNVLILARNDLSSFFSDSGTALQTDLSALPSIQKLDLSGILMQKLDSTVFSMFPAVMTLNLSGTGVDRLLGVGFQSLPQLRVLDLRGCPLTVIPRTLFHGLGKLHMVYADHFTICCHELLPPGLNLLQCHAPNDETSSCEYLLDDNATTLQPKPGATTLQPTPGATNLQPTPGATNLLLTPDATLYTPDATTLLPTPDATTLLPTPGATSLLLTPDATTLQPTPGATTLQPTPGATNLLLTPGATSLLPTQDSTTLLLATGSCEEKVTESERPQLEVICVSSTQGFVQTPDWDGHKSYPPLMDSWARVDVPKLHVVMVSVLNMDVDGQVTLYSGGVSDDNLVWKTSGRYRQDLNVLDTHVLHVHFTSNPAISGPTGFRLHFSFHNYSFRPLQLADERWNCSVPHWTDFKQHFPCNLVSDCLHGQDEAACPYSSARCGQGRLTAGGRCFLYVTSQSHISWDDAAMECLRRDARLASLNTPEEWRDVISLLEWLYPVHAYIGLRTASVVLPRMYRQSLEWEDGTIAFYLHLHAYYWRKPSCTHISSSTERSPKTKGYVLRSYPCNDRRMVDIFCELPEETAQNISRTGQKATTVVLSVAKWTSALSVTTCRDKGHLTHTFLACDSKSSCWSQGYGPSYSCAALMTPLPPSFKCRSNKESVPYTLVCDFRSDCSDASDEDFCVFRACETGQFYCGKKQCVPEDMQCDGVAHCVNNADETQCSDDKYVWLDHSISPPAQIDVNKQEELDLNVFSVFPNVQTLNLSESDVERVVGEGFNQLNKLR